MTADDGSTPALLSSRGIAAYRHDSGFQVVCYDRPGPLYDGCIVVPTLPVGEGGHPHTLEHLCFLGTDRHVRGYLDALAVHCLGGDGTNAWTAVDHTAYTVATASCDGFTEVFPVLLEHVLKPRLDEAAFASEVYYLRSDGTESGVVFCEMSGMENTEEELLFRTVRKTLYGNSSRFAMEHGGLCNYIRKLQIEDIRGFHAQYYDPSKITALVGGATFPENPEPILEKIGAILALPKATLNGHNLSLASDSDALIQNGSIEEALLKSLVQKRVHFPSSDELFGSVTLCWKGPHLAETREILALNILLDYLAENVSSPLHQRFVETEKPLSNMIYYSIELFPVTAIILTFNGVPARHDCDDGNSEHDTGDGVPDDLMEDGVFSSMVMSFLSEIISPEGIMIDGIRSIRRSIENLRVKFLSDIETKPSSVVRNQLIADLAHPKYSATYGKRLCDQLTLLDGLVQENTGFWISLLQKYFLTDKRGEIVMIPDGDLAKKISDDEKAAVQNRLSSFGEERRAAMEEEIKNMLDSVQTQKFVGSDFPRSPDLFTVQRIPYNETLAQAELYSVQKVQLDTSFVETELFWHTGTLTYYEQRCLPLLAETVLSMDVKTMTGKFIPYTDIAEGIASVTSYIYADSNRSISKNVFAIGFKALPSRFEDACNKITQAIFAGFVTKERLIAVAQNMITEYQENLRDGDSVCSSASSFVSKTRESAAQSCFVQLPFLEEVCHSLSGAGAMKTVENFQATWNRVRTLKSASTFLQVVSKDPENSLQVFTGAWSRMCGRTVTTESSLGGLKVNRSNLPIRSMEDPMIGVGASGKGLIIGVPGVEKSYVSVRLSAYISPVHADWAALEVLCELLGRVAGPLYNAVRDEGLAYGIHLTNKYQKSRLVVDIDETAVPADAWNAFCVVIKDYGDHLMEDASKVDEGVVADLELAKKGLLYRLLEEKSTPSSVGTSALRAASLGMPAGKTAGYTVEEAVERVDLGAVKSVFDSYVRKFTFESGRLVVIVCDPGVVEGVADSFKRSKFPVVLEKTTVDNLLTSAKSIR